MIPPEMTIMDAVKIVRGQAAKETGEVRSALTMLADLGEYHHGRQARRGRARKRRIKSAATPPLNRATPFKDLKPRSGDLKRSDLTSKGEQA